MGRNLSRREKRGKVLVPQYCPTLCSPMDCNSPGSSVHEIFQARMLEVVAISFSRAFSQPRDQTQVSYSAGGSFTIWATREAQEKVTRDKLWGEKMKNILNKIKRRSIIFFNMVCSTSDKCVFLLFIWRFIRSLYLSPGAGANLLCSLWITGPQFKRKRLCSVVS